MTDAELVDVTEAPDVASSPHKNPNDSIDYLDEASPLDEKMLLLLKRTGRSRAFSIIIGEESDELLFYQSCSMERDAAAPYPHIEVKNNCCPEKVTFDIKGLLLLAL